MNKWTGKVALVTGASSGIGAEIAIKLANSGMKVIGCGRNLEALQSIASKISKNGGMHCIKCDVSTEESILQMFKEVETKYGTLHVLINNAGLAHNAPLLSGTTEQWRSMMDINVMAPAICSREAIRLMDKAGVDDGYIVSINSTAGHYVDLRPDAHFYQVTKHALTALTKGLRHELVAKNSHIRVTSISPGLVKTDFQYRMYPGNTEKARTIHSRYEILTAEDIADQVIQVLSSPTRVNVCEIILKPTEQPGY